MLDRIRLVLARWFGGEALTQEQEWFHAQLTDLERRQVEADALTAELEARVAVLEAEEHADDARA